MEKGAEDVSDASGLRPGIHREEPFERLSESSNLSRSQLLLWMGQRLNPDAPQYNMVLTFEIFGEIRVADFRQAFRMLVDSSDAMRTRIVEVDGIPFRRVSDAIPDGLQEVDFSALQAPKAELAAWVRSRAQRPFRLDERLFDAVLVKLSQDRFVWYLNQHHLITDGWSVAITYRRLVDFYGLVNRQDAVVDSFPGFESYVDFERRSLEKPSTRKAMQHWRRKERPQFEPLEFYRSTPSVLSPRTERVKCELGPARSRKLKQLADEPGVRAFTADLSRFNLFATALFAYLSRVSGRGDLSILTPTHNRSTAEFKQTIGLFIEIFPLDVSVSDDDSYATLLAKVRRETQTFLANARSGTSHPAHTGAHDVLLNYITSSFRDFDGLPMTSEWIHPSHGDPAHSLRLQVQDFDAAGSFVLYFDLNRDVFAGRERRMVVQHFLAMLDGLLDDRSQRIADIDLLSDEERQSDLLNFNDTRVSWPATSVIQEFEARVDEKPDRVALECEGQRVTYEELDHRANQWAHHLHDRVPTHGLVALFLPRSPELLVAILACLKAGVAYLPLDRQTPRARVTALVQDSNAAAVMTTSEGALCLPPESRSIALMVDAAAEQRQRQPNTRLSARPAADALAYVIYTSGSTGAPKGVAVEHGALANYVFWAREHYLDGKRLDFPLFTSVSFDLTVTSIFVPLISGGRVVIYPDGGADPDLSVLRVMDEDVVDIIKVTPAHLALARQHHYAGARLRKIIVGGDDLKRDLAQAVTDQFGGSVEIFNEYGPTEATVGCMVHRFDAERDLTASVPIGRPTANTQIYILDRELRPTPAGVSGEIAIAGRGLAREYLGQPKLTSERFVPTALAPGGRMYLTGDRARRSLSGDLIFLGRADHQVKIKGGRVELSEIETALTTHERISECVVDVVETRGIGEPAEVAHVDHCVRCGLSSNHPAGKLDATGVCDVCHRYDTYRDHAQEYFRTTEELRELFLKARPRDGAGKIDCVMLLSGGKDSTYALYQLVDMGLRVLVFSLDNGYISDGAKANIKRAVDDLGLELVVGTTPAMNRIFADSLDHFSNVCQGCFKTIYTLGMQLARERDIGQIVTGLSRGQIFETRLANLYAAGIFAPDAIDRTILEARRAYHRVDDAVARNLDVDIFDDDRIFEDIRFIDFYRYCDVELAEVLAFLEQRAPWIRPADTGRSTNCLINDAGIYVHKKEKGYHNYALPYSWDVRLGHKTRDDALAELDDVIDESKVRSILSEVGYESTDRSSEKRLAAYFVTEGSSVSSAELRDYLSDRLPTFMVPSFFVPLAKLPLTTNGKVDRKTLPRPGGPSERLDDRHVAPRNETERRIAAIWKDVLQVDELGVHDHFLDLGGDSMLNIQIVSRARRAGLSFTPKQLFDHPTVARLVTVAKTVSKSTVDGGSGPLALTPIQRWFFEQDLVNPSHCNQVVQLDTTTRLDRSLLERAFVCLLGHHDALRLRFRRHDSVWEPVIVDSAAGASGPIVALVDLTSISGGDVDRAGAAAEAELNRSLDLTEGPLVKAALVQRGADRSDQLLVVIHHLAVDAVSWWTLLEDLETAYSALAQGDTPRLPSVGTSWQEWSAISSRSVFSRRELDVWTRIPADIAPLAVDKRCDIDGNRQASARRVKRRLDAIETRRLIDELPKVYQARIDDLLLTALTLSLNRWTGRSSVRLELEGHGRDEPHEGVDISRTVGWFTTLYPVTLAVDAHVTPGDALKLVKEQLRAVPRRGFGYGLLRYSGDAESAAVLEALPPADVLFNYLGPLDRTVVRSKLFRHAKPLAVSRDPRARRSHVLEVHAFLEAGELEVVWTYSYELHEAETIERIADDFVTWIRALVQHCLSSSDTGFTPSDFPEAGLTQDALDDVLSEFGESDA